MPHLVNLSGSLRYWTISTSSSLASGQPLTSSNVLRPFSGRTDGSYSLGANSLPMRPEEPRLPVDDRLSPDPRICPDVTCSRRLPRRGREGEEEGERPAAVRLAPARVLPAAAQEPVPGPRAKCRTLTPLSAPCMANASCSTITTPVHVRIVWPSSRNRFGS